MIDQEKIKQAEEYVMKNLINDLVRVHTQAIRPIAAKIADIEGGDKDIIDLAVLFHDIDRGKVDRSQTRHSLAGAETTRKAMEEIGFDKEVIEKVVHCVEAHSTPWSGIGPEPATIEAKVVYDADMTQQVSPFGIIKCLHEFGDNDFNELIKVAEDTLVNKIPTGIFTDTAKNMIKERMPYVKDFFARAKD
jgi:uncharacterized protein